MGKSSGQGLSIKKRLFLALTLLGTMLTVMSVSGWMALHESNASLQTVFADRVVPLRDLKIVADRYAVNIVDTTHKVRAGSLTWADGLRSVAEARRTITEQWAEYMATTMDAEERALADQVTASMRVADTAVDKLLGLLKSENRDGLNAFATEALYPAIDPVSDFVSKLVDLQIHEAQAEFNQSQRIYTWMTIALTAGIVIGLAVVGFAVLTTVRRVIRPLNAMTAAMTILAGGNKTAEIPATGQTDEIGAMAKAVLVFKENMIRNDELQAAAAKEQEERNRRAEKVDQLTKNFENEVSEILRVVASAATEMSQTANSLASSAEESSTQASAVAAASTQAAANVQTVASAAEELSSSISEISGQVSSSTQLTDRAVEEADSSRSLVQKLVESSSKIGQVVQLITEIAQQTNLLALNATIEAARAGEAGKGFAVVASEVKTLATQTAKATDEISMQIDAIQGDTGTTAEAIERIGQRIREVNDIATSIASAVEEQNAATQEISRNVGEAAKSTDEVTSNINGVSEAAQNTSAASAQMLQSSQELSAKAENLRGLVQTFLGDVRAA
jgi:methyl-accepting chemotaxis protein